MMRTPLGHSPLAPLVAGTMASQALLVVLAPTLAAVARDLGAPVAAVGQARAVTAAVAIGASVALTPWTARLGVARLLRAGAGIAVVASGAVAAAPTLAAFLAAHVLVGIAFACLLTAGFAGAAAFPAHRRGWALGHVAAANALAWVVANPAVGALADWTSWRLGHAVPVAMALVALALAGGAAVASAAPARGATPSMRAVLATGGARRWIAAELIAYAAWTTVLTFAGAFFVERLAMTEATTGWLLAAGALAYVIAATRSGGLRSRVDPRRLVVAAALGMAALMTVQFATRSLGVALTVFCLLGLVAGLRTPSSSALGLDQLPDHPGAMMAARTAATQLGYLLGAVIGGAVIAAAGYAALGGVLAVGMAASAALVLRVTGGPAAAPAR